ncbi:nuclease-related domain-containing protein [Cytobacillus pseudoceanisediminis]|uniref:nuclease-related domain-containing protein n=1 Tax=Cytobacillus pseudoceanisediminis TaxID=3051614 RepID=UPI003C30C779
MNQECRKICIRKRILFSNLKRSAAFDCKRPIYTRGLAGYKGEQAIDFHLSKLPEKEFLIFHDLRLSSGKHFFQIDTLILNHASALILEVKNYGGTLYFDPDSNQLIHTTSKGEVKGYPNPIGKPEYNVPK